MPVELWLFALIFIPMVIIIGIATACIGFTAWNIVVPLMFIAFGFPAYDSIFFSLMIDFVDSIILTIRYSRTNHVAFKEGTMWGIIAIIGVIIGSFFSYRLITADEGILRGGVSVVTYFIAAGFFLRGWVALQKTKLPQDQVPKPNEGKFISYIKTLPAFTIPLVIAFAMIFSGLMVGILGIGSGMNFVLIFMMLLSFDILKATGTGCYMMALVTGIAMLIFAKWVHFPVLWPYLVIGSLFAIFGTMLGSIFTLKLSKEKVNFLVGISMLLAAIIATIENAFLN